MNEKCAHIPSAEKGFVINKNEILAYEFAGNPLRVLKKLRGEIISKTEQYAKDEYPNPVFETMSFFDWFTRLQFARDISLNNLDLKPCFVIDSDQNAAWKGIFSLLQKSGFQKEEIKQWIDYEYLPKDNDLSSYRHNQRLLGALDIIYGKYDSN